MTSHAGRAVIAALRLDRWDEERLQRTVDEALACGVGGFVLFGGRSEKVSTLTARIRAEAGRDLWFAADLERGAGQQFHGLTELPPPAALARHHSPEEAVARAASLTAAEARSVGINWVLAPVLDIDAEPDNPIVATRSFTADPTVVSALGLAWIRACQGAGALACAKHFPGHGRTLGDSHVEMPVVDVPMETLEDDLAPFAHVADEVGSAMVAHVSYPALGSSRAATVAPEIVDELLRSKLGFEGLVATDAMIMSGIGEDDASAAVEALRAGCDVILYPSDPGRTVLALERAADGDPAFADRLEASISRGAAMLAKFGQQPDAGSPDVRPFELATETIVDRAGSLGGWSAGAPTRVVAVSDDPEVGPPAGREGPLGTIVEADLRRAGWNIDDGADRAPDQRIVVLAATPRGWKGHGRVSDEATRRIQEEMGSAERALLVLLGHDRWLEELGVPGICAWSTETAMERAAATWIDRRVRAGAGGVSS